MNTIALFFQRIWAKHRVVPALILLTGFAVTLFASQPARAHALLERSFPEPNSELTEAPRMIELFFSEPLESGFSNIRLIDSLGGEVEIAPTVVDSADPTRMTADLSLLDPGIYTVAWQTLSQVDGHEWYGSYPFTVLNPDGTRPSGQPVDITGGDRGELPSFLEVATRWLGLLGGAFLFGVPVFVLVVVSSFLQQEPDGLGKRIKEESGRLAVPMVWLGALAVLLGGWLGLLNQALRLGGPDQLPNLVLGTRTGTLVLARTVLIFSTFLVVLSLPQPQRSIRRKRALTWVAVVGFVTGVLILVGRTFQGDTFALAMLLSAAFALGLAFWTRGGSPVWIRTWQSLVLLSVPLLLTFSLGSHAGAADGSVWAVLGDFVHMAAAATWVGGLVLLGLLLVRARRTRRVLDPSTLPALLTRFSNLASLAVFLVLVTGLFNSLVELPNPQSLFTTAYGRVLLVKLALVGIALLIALYNNRVVHHRVDLLRTEVGETGLQRRVIAESLFSLGILLVVAVLVQTPAPRPLAENVTNVVPDLPFNTLAQMDDLYVHLKVSPNEIGENEFWVHLYHSDGSVIGEVQLVRLSFDYAQADFGSSQIDLAPIGLDVFEQTGANLSQAGAWDVSVYVRRRGMDDVIGSIGLDVRAIAGARRPINPWGNPVPGLPPLLILGSALVFVGLIPVVWGLQSGRTRRRRMPITLASDLLLFLGITLVLGGVAGIFLADRLNPSQVPPSEGSIAAGETLYMDNCSVCHGDRGLGDGPLGLTLQPPPAVLQTHVPLHADEELYGFIAQGFPNTAMRGFEGELSPAEIWHLVNYLRDQFGELALEDQ